jgi:hypothetical protein
MSKNVLEFKKLFTKYSDVNFFNEFTLQDVEDAKKKSFFALSAEQPHNIEGLKSYLENGAKELMEHKFMNGQEGKAVGVLVKNTVKDTLNPNYKNTYKRLLCIDSQYRPNIYNYNDNDCHECDFTVALTEKLINVTSIQIENIQIPFTFYNIERRKSNNYFYVGTTFIEIPDSYYTISTLITQINDSLIANSITDLIFGIDPSSQKVRILNNTGTTKIIQFYDSTDFEDSNDIITNTKDTTYLNTTINNNIGWYLGFRKVFIDNSHIDLSYTILTSVNIESDAIPMIPTTKYFTIVVNDYNQNNANGTIVQSKIDSNYIKPTTYFNFQNTTTNKSLDCLTCNNIQDFIDDKETRTLTKAQLYSRAELNKNKSSMKITSNYRLDCKTYNHALAVIPFDPSLTFGKLYFNDKIDYKREYHGPVEIDKLHVQVYDDKGLLLNLNGNDWYMTLSTEHLYKY